MASSINFNRLFPISDTLGLPEVTHPDWVHGIANGKVEKTADGYLVQWIPTDSYERFHANGNKDYDERSLYKLNKHCFRADDFKSTKYSNKKKIMFAGCSHTFGIGLDQHETFADIICKEYDAVNWNIGAGGIGNECIALNISQMIENGYIPDILYVQWTYLHRQLMIVDKSDPIVDDFANYVGEPDNEYSSIYYEKYSKHVTNMINNAKQEAINKKILSIEDQESKEQMYHWHGHDTHADKDAGSLQAGQYNATFGHKSLCNHFYLLRENVILLCKLHGIQLKEIFADEELVNFVSKKVVPNKGYTTGKIPMLLNAFQSDYARDNHHLGKETNKRIAKYLMDHTDEK